MTKSFSYNSRSGHRVTLYRKRVAGKWVFTSFDLVNVNGKVMHFDAAAEPAEFYREVIAELLGEIGDLIDEAAA